MTKTEAVFVPDRVWSNELLSHEAEKHCRRRRAELRRNEVEHGPEREVTTDHGRALEHGAVVSLEAVEASRENGLNRRWHGDACPLVGGHRRHLLHEERVPLGCLRDSAARGVRCVQHLQELGGFFVVQRVEGQSGRLGLVPRPVGAVIEKLGACKAEQQDWSLRDPALQVLHEIEEGRLPPMDVLEADDERSFGGESLELLADAPEDLLACPLEGLVRQDLPHRPERDSLAVRKAAPDQDARFARDSFQQFARKSRLADPGQTEHGDELWLPCLDRPRVRGHQRLQLPPAADHRSVEPARKRLRRQIDLVHAMCPDAVLLPLDGERLAGSSHYRVADDTRGRLADEDLAGACGLLDSLREIDRVAGHEPVTCGWVARDHLAGVDADPDLEPCPPSLLEFHVQLPEAIPHRCGGSYSP